MVGSSFSRKAKIALNSLVIFGGATLILLAFLIILVEQPVKDPNQDYVRAFLGTMAALSTSLAGLINASVIFLAKGRFKSGAISIFRTENIDVVLMETSVMFFLLTALLSITNLLRMTSNALPDTSTLTGYLQLDFFMWKLGLSALISSIGSTLVYRTYENLKPDLIKPMMGKGK